MWKYSHGEELIQKSESTRWGINLSLTDCLDICWPIPKYREELVTCTNILMTYWYAFIQVIVHLR